MSAKPSLIDRFVDYYTVLDSQSVHALAELYDEQAVLIDPFGEHNGLFAIQGYFMRLLSNVNTCQFTIDPPLYDAGRFSVTWTMNWSHARIAAGETCSLPGCSMINVADNKIIRQHDYYDAGEMLYEHLPLLGWAVRSVKKRMRA